MLAILNIYIDTTQQMSPTTVYVSIEVNSLRMMVVGSVFYPLEARISERVGGNA